MWAALTALADAQRRRQLRVRRRSASSTRASTRSPPEPGAADAFNDVTFGDNNPTGTGAYPATPGYDMATGLGTPIATDGAHPGLVAQLCAAPCARSRAAAA